MALVADLDEFTSNQLRDELSRRAAVFGDGRCWYCGHSLLTHTCREAVKEKDFGLWEFQAPHFVDSENCMGQEERYWRVFARHRDTGKHVLGTGDTVDQATRACVEATRKETS